MGLLVRTWNLFHGNTVPPGRKAYLEEMVRLASADGPDVLCLQEVPVWGLARLEAWSGMTALGAVAARSRLGSARLGGALTSLHHGLLRSALTGQANAILLSRALRPHEHEVVVLRQARERRVCQAVRVELPGGATMLLANLHATSHPPDDRLAEAEVRRAIEFLVALARPGEPWVLAGDFNVEREWGFEGAGPGIDQVLVRGAAVSERAAWPDERRRLHGRLLSDHAPVEVRIG